LLAEVDYQAAQRRVVAGEQTRRVDALIEIGAVIKLNIA